MVLGIRPDIIRASKIIQLLRKDCGSSFQLVWTGQHYSPNLKSVFFEELDVPYPDVELSIHGSSDAELTSSAILNLYNYLQDNRPDVVVFLGDTNTVVSSIAAAQLNIPIVHIEGCMRSYDWIMPEEKYRTIVDHISDLIFAYTENYKENGILEGIRPSNIKVTGNPIVEVLQSFTETTKFKEQQALSVQRRNLTAGEYLLATCHRRENVESKETLDRILSLISRFERTVVLPLSYRTKYQLEKFELVVPQNVRIEEPVGYLDFVSLLKNSVGVITDSGTVIEEACILGVPSIQMRMSTERPEVYEVGSSIKFDPTRNANFDEIIFEFEKLSNRVWKQPFGDGLASNRIATEIIKFASDVTSGHSPDLNKQNVKRSFMSHNV